MLEVGCDFFQPSIHRGSQPAPQVAIDYYLGGDLYLFEEFQTASEHKFRHPKIENLYDVFVNIREDECAHVKTMKVLQLPEARLTFKSPHTVLEVSVASIDKVA